MLFLTGHDLFLVRDHNSKLQSFFLVSLLLPLGSKLLIMYVNDMCNISKLVKYILDADNTNIFCTDSDIRKLSDNMCNILDKMSSWFAVSRLTLKKGSH